MVSEGAPISLSTKERVAIGAVVNTVFVGLGYAAELLTRTPGIAVDTGMAVAVADAAYVFRKQIGVALQRVLRH